MPWFTAWQQTASPRIEDDLSVQRWVSPVPEGVEIEAGAFVNTNSRWREWGGQLYVSAALIRVKENQYLDGTRVWSAGSGENQTPVDIQSEQVSEPGRRSTCNFHDGP
jgi:hypothetical protein